MAQKRELVQFTISNLSDCGYNLPLFQQNPASINATTKYSWDITTQVLSCGSAQIVINGITYNVSFEPNLAGLLAALNALGFGFFCTEIVSGDTFLYTVDDVNIYGDVTLCDSGETTTTTTTTTTTEPQTTTTTTTTTTEPQTTTTTTTTTTEPQTTTTTTTTTTEPPTTTTTTTTTTGVTSVNLYAKLQDTYTPIEALRIEYSFDNLSWEDFELSGIASTSCTFKNTIGNVPLNNTLYLRVGEGIDVVEHYSAVGSSVCPDSGTTLCLTSFLVTGATDVAFTVLISGGSTIDCVTTTTTTTTTTTAP